MRRKGPSLAFRLSGAFLLAYAAIMVALVILANLLSGATDEEAFQSDGAYALTLHDLETDPAGRLRLKPGGRALELARRSPGFWAFARTERAEFVYGRPPEDVVRSIRAAPFASFRDYSAAIPSGGPDGEVSLWVIEGGRAPAGQVILGVGGATEGGGGLIGAALYMNHIQMHWGLLFLAGVGIVAVLLVVPFVLRTVRPLTRAVTALDPNDLEHRLPEAVAPRELRPVVRAFNAALDRLEDVFERRRRFMADVAHEFRTPLAVLTMHVEALEDGSTKADLQRGVFRLTQLIGQMLDSERMGGPGRQREQVDLITISRAAVAEVAPLAVDAGYEVAFTAPDQPVTVEADTAAVKRALTNLLGNAVAHGGDKGVITVRVRRDQIVEVGDEGPGVPLEARERVFDPFYRERWDKDGCGLGLHLVQEIMRAHGGRAEVADHAPGALFRLIFPPAPPQALPR